MRIAVIGGGSYCWTPTLVRDMIFTPGLEGSEIVLEDIEKKHLDDLYRCCKAILAQTRKEKAFKVSATMDEAKALRGADYVVLTITTGGYKSMANDLRIPYQYGLYQPVGDTVGPGGISRAVRNIPVVVGIAKNMERCCPDAWLLNITNPMSTLTRCVWRETSIRCIGLCHELYGTLRMLERLLGAQDWRRDFDCVTVGVNHLPWIIKLCYKGKDAFPLLQRKLRQMASAPSSGKGLGTALDHTLVGSNQVKFALFEAFGALPAAGDRHLAEFFPYFCTREMKKGAAMGVALTTIEDRQSRWTPAWKRNVADIASGRKPISTTVSLESTSKVIAALAGITEWKDVLNLPNQGQVAELPRDAVVETMGFITRNAAYGLPTGPVPPAILTQLQRHVTNQEMTVEAALEGDRSLLLQALLNDPMCGSIRDFRQMRQMMEELLTANRKWLPNFFRKK
jgi:alpha-galactosidase